MKRRWPTRSTIVTAFFYALFLATALLWLRSYRHQDVLRWRTHTASNYRVYTLCIGNGELALDRSDFSPWPADVAGEYGLEFFTDPLEPGVTTWRAWQAWYEFASGSPAAAANTSWHHIGFAGGSYRNVPNGVAVAAVMFAVAPFWPIAALTGLIPLRGIWRWGRAARRRRMKLCPNCAYNLTGNTSGVCPECGGKVEVGT
ncbi:MAG TPA: hypothetical protein VH370_07865 [Humisphaera sp.]|jgi:hypothetical protein|nr:hypothetical protein [Humisphaera sp.]